MHPGGGYLLLDKDVAGKDATECEQFLKSITFILNRSLTMYFLSFLWTTSIWFVPSLSALERKIRMQANLWNNFVEVLVKYGRLIIGTIEKEETRYILPTPGVLSPVPYSEPNWLTPGFKSPCQF